MISWSFIRGILVCLFFMYNLNTPHAGWGTLAICGMIVLAGIECAHSKKLQIAT